MFTLYASSIYKGPEAVLLPQTVLNFPMDNERTAATRVKMGETVLPQREKSFEYKGFSTSSPVLSYHCMSWILATLIKGEMG